MNSKKERNRLSKRPPKKTVHRNENKPVNRKKRKRQSDTREQYEHVKKNKTKRSATKRKKQKVNAKKIRTRKKKIKNVNYFLLELVSALVLVSVLLYMASIFFFSFAKVEGYAMVPNLRDGDVVYINKRAKIKLFDLVYIKHKGTNETEIRRIIGLPDQQVVYKNDQLKIDGAVKEEYFITNAQQEARQNGRLFTEDLSILSLTGKTTIPEKKYFVLGDNRPYSNDSRRYGLIDETEIVGKVEMKVLPFHQMSKF